MKTKIVMLVGLSLIAAPSYGDCLKTVEKEIRKTHQDTETVFYDIAAQQVKSKAGVLKYLVTVGSQYNDGASSGAFPTETFEVFAKGDASQCSVFKVTKVLKNTVK